MKKLISLVVAFFLSVFGAAATAEPKRLLGRNWSWTFPPRFWMKLRKTRLRLPADPAHVNQLVDKEILPDTDFATMTRMAWRSRPGERLTQAQRKEIMQLFRTLLVAVYSGALKEANNYTVEPAKSRPSNRLLVCDDRPDTLGGQPARSDSAGLPSDEYRQRLEDLRRLRRRRLAR